MASPKRSSANRKRERIVPVRVIRGPRPSRAQAPTGTPHQRVADASNRRTPAPVLADRRMVMWTSVVVAAAIIFVLWLGFLKADLRRSTSPDTFFNKIRNEFSRVFSGFRSDPSSGTNTNDAALQELRSRVFPELKDRQFITNDTTSNANATP